MQREEVMDQLRNTPVFAVIGDSAAFGTGDEIKPGEFRGWARILAENFRDGCEYLNFARPGAKSTEVSTIQLEKAIANSPDICAVIAGGNDLLRNDFDPVRLYQNLKFACEKLGEIGSEVLMFELHDPNRLIKLPKVLKRLLAKRVEAVNHVYRKISLEFDVTFVKTREIQDVHELVNWHIDRMHPGPKGHFILARKFSELLRNRGWNIQMPAYIGQINRSKRQNRIWLIRNGLPWFLKRSVDLLPAILILLFIETLKLIPAKLRGIDLDAIPVFSEIEGLELPNSLPLSQAS
jgi:lysophospholipase L1-like esterase